MAKNIQIRNVSKKKLQGISLAGTPPGGSSYASNEGVLISTEFFRNDIVGKPYPGHINYVTQRMLAQRSTVVRAIVSMRTQQVAMLPFSVVPSNEDEPTRKTNIFDYNHYEITHHPALDRAEKDFLKSLYLRLDPDAYKINKQSLYEAAKEEGEFSGAEIATVTHLQNKHDDFYEARDEDIAVIKEILNNPDPIYTNTTSWSQLLQAILADLITLDRGAIFKLRDEEGNIRGLLPMDGTSIRPLIDEYGYVDPDKAYVQIDEKSGTPYTYLKHDDVIILSMHRSADMRYFGYGISPMETLFTAALADIYIDKGQLDFYRKGGSIPEGFLSIEPPTSRDGMISHMDQETIEYMQRNLQSIMAGDYTQVPIFSGGKVTFTDFKGKRRDMQYQELALYMTRKIAAVMQVSPQDIGITQDINRSSGDVQQELTKSKGLLPLMNTISEYITNFVISEIRPERDLKLAFEDSDAEREQSKWTIAQQQLISGVMTINEYRMEQGKSPVPWGNTPLQGLRNWKDENEEEEEGMGGPPPGMPPLPAMGGGMGGPPPGGPTMMNPGGPVGGANPMAGRPPMDAMKSSKFFALKAVANEQEAEELMVNTLAQVYNDGSNFTDMLELYDVHNYPGGEWLRTPTESYSHFAKTHKSLGINLELPEKTDGRDVIVLSRVEDGRVVVGEGLTPVIKSMAQVARENLPQDKLVKIEALSNGEILEGVERYIYSKLDEPLQEALYQDFYKFKSFAITDARMEKIIEVLDE